jgi:hypothetical protein
MGTTTTTGPSSPSGVIQRKQIGGHRNRLTAAPRQSVPAPTDAPMSAPAVITNDDGGASTDSDDETPDLLTQFDRILELLEDRILRELERRGGRFRGGF